MMDDILNTLEKLLTQQHYGVFNTIRFDTPHSTLVCFAPNKNLTKLVFMTPEQTRKTINSKIHDKVSLFVDNRKNEASDIKEATTIVAYGRIVAADETEKQVLTKAYLEKNPHMEFFVTPSVKLMVIEVNYYEIVSQFQSVKQLRANQGSFSVSIRQIMGQSFSTGYLRGDLSDDKLVLVDSPTILNLDQATGIITNQQDFKARAESLDIPVVYLEDLTVLEGVKHVTIDGYLGFVIIHDIKK